MIRHVADRLRPITLPLHRLLSRLAPRRVEALLLATGLALLGLWAAHQNGIRAYEVGASRRLDLLTYAAQVGRPGNEPDPATGVAAVVAGSNLIGRIEIPRLDISAIIAEGTNPGTLKRAVGHIRSTAYPGEAGNVGLAGHRDTHFRGLGRVQLNDLIRLVTPEGTFDYRVEWTKVVSPRRVEVLKPAGAPSVTLVTCYPFNYVGSAPKRFIVRARLVSESVAALNLWSVSIASRGERRHSLHGRTDPPRQGGLREEEMCGDAQRRGACSVASDDRVGQGIGTEVDACPDPAQGRASRQAP